MGRRSDHTREELRDLLVTKGHDLMAEVGYARFSGREVAKRAGYSVGTIYNVFGSLEDLLAAINTRTFEQWAAHLQHELANDSADRIASLVRGYFAFALENQNIWSAIYDHKLPDGQKLSERDLEGRGTLTRIVEQEVRLALPTDTDVDVARYSRSLIATVHGHCSYMVSGSFALLDEKDPVGSALDRVRESLSVHQSVYQ